MTEFLEPELLRIGADDQGALFVLRPEVRTLRVSGPDRARFLNGMLTNEVADLAPGQGVLAVKTNRKAKIEGVLRVRATEDALDLDLLAVAAPRVQAALESHLIMDDAAIAEVSSTRQVLTVFGPRAAEWLAAEPLPPHHARAVTQFGMPALLIADRTLGFVAFELHTVDSAPICAGLVALGAHAAAPEELDTLRIAAGWPLDGPDLDEDTFPMEAGLELAISYRKGCYIGQETISRAKHLGHMNYKLVRLSLSGEVPAGAKLFDAAGKAVGELTSRALAKDGVIGLGYLRTEFQAAGTKVALEGGGEAVVQG